MMPLVLFLALLAVPADPATCDAKPFTLKKPATTVAKAKPKPPAPKPPQTAAKKPTAKPGKPGCDPITGK